MEVVKSINIAMAGNKVDSSQKLPKISVVGGGTGISAVLRGLKTFPVDISAIVTVADSGGSTGRLRQQFGFLPAGDIRQALIALSRETPQTQVLQELMKYRFAEGPAGLGGHNLGNLILTALTELQGSDESAISFLADLLQINGAVLPVALKPLTLCAQYTNNVVVKGEASIDDPPGTTDDDKRIFKLWVEPSVGCSEKVKVALSSANMIVLGPGDLYTSILANIVVPGVKDAILNSSAKLVYVLNITTRYGQTHSFGAMGHVEEVAKYVGKYPDIVLINSAPVSKEILDIYAKENKRLVEDDLDQNVPFKVIRTDLLSKEVYTKAKEDKVPRSSLRHDPSKVAKVLISLL